MGSSWLTRRHEFISRGQDRHAGPTTNPDFRVAEVSEDGELQSPEHKAGTHEALALTCVRPGGDHVVPGPQRQVQPNAVRNRLHHLLGYDGIGSRGKRSAG